MSTVSILMPVKNTGKFLPACLDSIIAQTYSDWELIAVNDHSDDNSFAILQQYEHQDQRITALNSKDMGIIAALRTAYKHSNGNFITRMDSDDLMSGDKLALFVEALKNEGQGCLTTGLVKYISETGVGDGYKNYEKWLNDLTMKEANFSDIYKECCIASPNWMVHRKDFERCGAFHSDVYPEDYDLCFRFRAAGLQLRKVDSVTHYWRDYPTRTSRTDSNYADNKFSELKVRHFLEQDYKPSKQLVLWGAGNKGKSIAKLLSEQQIEFRWLCNNPNKIGHEVYGVVLEDSKVKTEPGSHQIIIAISQKGFNSTEPAGNMGSDVFYFC